MPAALPQSKLSLQAEMKPALITGDGPILLHPCDVRMMLHSVPLDQVWRICRFMQLNFCF